MDTTPQSSFIPKKQMSGGAFSSHSGGFFSFIANLIFILALVASAGVFVYSKYLSGRISKMESDLSAARVALQPDLIEELAKVDERLISANEIVNKHLTLSAFFELLQTLTLQSVQFTTFGYDVGEGGKILLVMEGEARNYATVALQAEILQTNSAFINPVFSDLDLSEGGNVIFSLRSELSPRAVSYIENLTPIMAPIQGDTVITPFPGVSSEPSSASGTPNVSQ